MQSSCLSGVDVAMAAGWGFLFINMREIWRGLFAVGLLGWVSLVPYVLHGKASSEELSFFPLLALELALRTSLSIPIGESEF